MNCKPVLLEPIMKVEIEVPTNFQGPVTGNLTSRRGMVVASEVQGATAVIEAEVPLSETFGYSTSLRSLTQGQGTFTMEICQVRPRPWLDPKEIVAERKKASGQLVGAK